MYFRRTGDHGVGRRTRDVGHEDESFLVRVLETSLAGYTLGPRLWSNRRGPLLRRDRVEVGRPLVVSGSWGPGVDQLSTHRDRPSVGAPGSSLKRGSDRDLSWRSIEHLDSGGGECGFFRGSGHHDTRTGDVDPEVLRRAPGGTTDRRGFPSRQTRSNDPHWTQSALTLLRVS